ncbi:MAG TPA: YtxH domain-containing protein [Chitinophagaceae bacterium]|nr:YtxH domain-containing protein [Chitinophagaceae bacterium]
MMTNTNKIIAALGIGMAAGAVAGLLLAPRKGSETRELLAQKGTKISGNIKEGFQEGQKKFNSLKDGLKEGLNTINKKVEEVM